MVNETLLYIIVDSVAPNYAVHAHTPFIVNDTLLYIVADSGFALSVYKVNILKQSAFINITAELGHNNYSVTTKINRQ